MLNKTIIVDRGANTMFSHEKLSGHIKKIKEELVKLKQRCLDQRGQPLFTFTQIIVAQCQTAEEDLQKIKTHLSES